MNDKELLELAAKAAGMRLNHAGQPTTGNYYDLADFNWNPLTDDGDALRLAVKLKLNVLFWDVCLSVDDRPLEMYENDSYAATRRAIVKAAAEIGREMKTSDISESDAVHLGKSEEA